MKSIYRLIKINRLLRSARIKFLLVLLADIFHIRHLFLRLDPVNACNLSCAMCYYSDKAYAKRIRGRFSVEELERINGLFFKRTLQLVIGCGSEPTLYRHYPELVRSARNAGIPFIGITTNGLLMKRDQLARLVDYGLDEITVSVHGVRQSTYENLMVGGSYAKLHEVLGALLEIKAAQRSSKPALRINYTVNQQNLDELKSFFSVYGKYRIATLQIRPMVDVGHTAYSYSPLDERALKSYHDIISELEKECKELNVTLLATKKDPNFHKEDHSTSYALPAVLRHIHPNKVWMNDFQWRTESYREYCQRSEWRKTLFQSIFSQNEYFRTTKHHLTYDVDL